MNFVLSIILVMLAILVNLSGQKLYGLWKGYNVEFRPWIFGLIISLIIAILLNGKPWFLLPLLSGGIILHHMQGHRLGKFRYGLNYYDLGLISLAGPIANIVLATLVKNIELYLPFLVVNQVLIDKIFVINWAYAVYTFLPIPPLPGSNLLYASRLTYSFVFGSIISYFILIVTFKMYSFIWAILLGGIIWFVYMRYFEKSVG